MRKAILSLLLVFIGVTTSFADPVTQAQALQKATLFLTSRGIVATNLSLVRQERQGAPSNQSSAKEASYYVFNRGDEQGFVIVSGDDATYDILGYADQGHFDLTDIPENLQALLDDYVEEITWARTNTGSPAKAPSNNSYPTNETRQIVAPLLSCNWGQDSPYNQQCFTPNGAQAVTGCVATAFAQVMYYYKWPRTSTTEIPAYNTSSGNSYDALPPVIFDWVSMQNSYNRTDDLENASTQAVATLMKYCGHAVNMEYGVNASSAPSAKIPDALCNYFGYANHATEVKREKYDIDGWDQLVYEELVAGRPVIYSASSSGGGHAFVCDGFDGYGLFHINWGWSGLSNGYFRLQALNTNTQGTGGSSSSGGYSNGQYALIGISPQALKPYSGDDGFGIATLSFTLIDKNAAEQEESTATYNATSGLRPFRVKYQYTQSGLAPSYDVGIGLFDHKGVLTDTYVVKSNYQGRANMTNTSTFYLSSFGKIIEDGSYVIKGIDRVCGTEEWHLSKNSDKYYLQVEKNGDQATLKTVKVEVTADISATQVSQNIENGTSPKCIRVFLKNNGSSEFNSPIYFYMNDRQGRDSLVAYETAYLSPGAEDYIDFYVKKGAGTFSVTFSLKTGPTNIIYSNDAFILTDESTLPVLDYVSSEVKNIDGNIMYGSLIDGNITLTNNTSTDYNHPLSLKLLKPRDATTWWVFTETIPASIPAGQTVTIPFQLPISVGETFRLTFLDINKTFATISAKTVKAAMVSWKADGERTAAAPTATMTVPTDAVAVSFDELGDLSSYAITTNDNPNTLYYLPHDADIPSILQGRNVVKDYEAESITLTDGHDFYVPKAFSTSHITYTRKPALSSNGQVGWETIHLPFSVQKVATSSTILNQLRGVSTAEGYWLKSFDRDNERFVSFTDVDEWTPNTPFLIGTSECCKGNDLVLSADNVMVQKTPANIVVSKNYQFIGTTGDKTAADAYVMNDSGTAFVLTNLGDVDAFHAFFTTSQPLADAPALLPISFLIGDVNGDGTVNVSDVTILVNHILNIPGTSLIIPNGDANGDGTVNVTDVTGIVNIILHH